MIDHLCEKPCVWVSDQVLHKLACSASEEGKGLVISDKENREIIRIYHELVNRIVKSVPSVTVWHHKLCLVMPNSDPRDRFVYPFLKIMLDSFPCILLGAST